ncbi:hypothetical protein QA601_02740 [Chitinispirillales bacterium ANBcel5]|uniref:hypothetical protein n=1 Tax=Cellulosispirillum alkaliphilum TaxID=3039283 RepID=UPI002A57B145|nr:hypothetical protein [Chitinispirillales bacterium ANBcel5]
MTEIRDPIECFNAVKEDILSIPDDNLTVINMPFSEAMQEGGVWQSWLKNMVKILKIRE